ncbi:MAG: helix-turn-helix domain-containing protein [Frankia sp.]
MIVHDATRVRPLRALFDRYWSAGRAIGTGAPADEVAGRRAAIIELMAEGLTDPAIAVHLGISLRTVTRQVKALMQETRSVSRFQLGYALARHSAEEQ